ncbi:MAG TPA: hypothetical protein VLH84_05045 [Patescibacteria group bacterium]|nr:hypothetical protein [Patescibacteria group bacterium]
MKITFHPPDVPRSARLEGPLEQFDIAKAAVVALGREVKIDKLKNGTPLAPPLELDDLELKLATPTRYGDTIGVVHITLSDAALVVRGARVAVERLSQITDLTGDDATNRERAGEFWNLQHDIGSDVGRFMTATGPLQPTALLLARMAAATAAEAGPAT